MDAGLQRTLSDKSFDWPEPGLSYSPMATPANDPFDLMSPAQKNYSQFVLCELEGQIQVVITCIVCSNVFGARAPKKTQTISACSNIRIRSVLDPSSSTNSGYHLCMFQRSGCSHASLFVEPPLDTCATTFCVCLQLSGHRFPFLCHFMLQQRRDQLQKILVGLEREILRF